MRALLERVLYRWTWKIPAFLEEKFPGMFQGMFPSSAYTFAMHVEDFLQEIIDKEGKEV